jgi:aldehyde:ferredoxin oxidoreductase
VLFAAVVNDLHRAAGRSGVGAVMGSKNLKAIAVRGTKGVGNLRDPKAFMRSSKPSKKKILAENGVTGQGLPAYGTQVLMNVINEVGGLPTRNHRDNQFEGAKDIGAEAMATPRKTDGKKQLVTNQACFGCTIACGRISKMDENHFTVENKPQYWGASGGLEYEAAWALGAANGVNDLEALQYVNMLCNEEGMDPITFGATIGAVMELYAMGILTKEQLGIEAPFGSARALGFPGRETVNGRGFGKEIGQGSKRLTAKYGHPELSMSSRARSSRPTTGAPSRAWPGLRHQQPRRLPPARLHDRVGSPGHPGQDRSAGKPRASPNWSRPSRMPRPRLTHPVCASSPPSPGVCRPVAADAGCMR